MSDATKVFLPIAVGPSNSNVAASKAVLYVAFRTTAVVPNPWPRAQGRIRYVGP